MREVQLGGAPMNAAFTEAMDACVVCRGCEVACPSSVPFGHLMEGARAALAPRRPPVRRMIEWLGYRVVLPHHALLLALTWLLAFAQRLRLVPRRFGLPRDLAPLAHPTARRRIRSPIRSCSPGCVMDAWQRDVHRAALTVMRAAGAHPGSARLRWRVLRRAPPARGTRRGREAPRPAGDRFTPRRRARGRRQRRVWRGDEGLRPPARHRRELARSRAGSGTSPSGWWIRTPRRCGRPGRPS